MKIKEIHKPKIFIKGVSDTKIEAKLVFWVLFTALFFLMIVLISPDGALLIQKTLEPLKSIDLTSKIILQILLDIIIVVLIYIASYSLILVLGCWLIKKILFYLKNKLVSLSY